MGSDRRPIIVGGCHRSGTSLIRRVLNAHSHIFCGPEVKFFRDFYGDYEHDPLAHLRFVNSARAIASDADLLDVLGQAFISLHERAASRAGKARWADKCPENVLHLDDWERLLGPNWLFIHVVRNPLDTLASVAEARFDLAIPTEFEERVAFYRRYTLEGLRFGDAHPDRYYRLLYEQFVREPESQVADLMRWLGELPEPSQLTFNNAAHQAGLEDPKVTRTSRVHADSIGRWRGILSGDEASSVWQATRDLWARVDPDGRYGAISGLPPARQSIWRVLFHLRALRRQL